jgi:hypothetical protein
MALNIRKGETEELADTPGRLTGESKTEAVKRSLRERVKRVRAERSGRTLVDELDEIALHCSRLPVRDSRPADEILRYDESP